MEVSTVSASMLAQVAPERVTPGLLGFLVVVGLGLATWFLLRSMNRQLRRIRFEERPTPPRRKARPGAADRDRPQDAGPRG